MALQRLWRGRPRGLRELPTEVVQAIRYGGPDPDGKVDAWWLNEANLSINGWFLRLTFDDKPGVVDYWTKTMTGWGICGVPSIAELQSPTGTVEEELVSVPPLEDLASDPLPVYDSLAVAATEQMEKVG